MWPFILLGLAGGGYWYWKNKSATTTTPILSAYHPAIMSLPPAGSTPPQNTSVYTPGPVVQTPSGGQSGIPQYPSPISTSPAPVAYHPHAYDPSALLEMSQPVVTQKLPNPDGSITPAPLPAPMPSGVTNAKGELITWSPFSAGAVTFMYGGKWIYSKDGKTNLTIYAPQGSITLPGSMFGYNIDTAELRF